MAIGKKEDAATCMAGAAMLQPIAAVPSLEMAPRNLYSGEFAVVGLSGASAMHA